jgi:hypothetical protein
VVAAPRSRHVGCGTTLAGLYHIDGISPAHLSDETVTNNVMTMVRRLIVAVTALPQGVVRLRVLLLGEDSPGSLESSPEISFCPECYDILLSNYLLQASVFIVSSSHYH